MNIYRNIYANHYLQQLNMTLFNHWAYFYIIAPQYETSSLHLNFVWKGYETYIQDIHRKLDLKQV